jgi:hypothetical protein
MACESLSAAELSRRSVRADGLNRLHRLACHLDRRQTDKSCQEREGQTLNMPDKEVQIDFHAPATLRNWPSVNNERVSTTLGARPYLIIDDTLDECIRRFMSQPKSQHHLYEIHTAPQSDLVSAVLSAEHIVELARLRDFL